MALESFCASPDGFVVLMMIQNAFFLVSKTARAVVSLAAFPPVRLPSINVHQGEAK
jgi:hypothetical protein